MALDLTIAICAHNAAGRLPRTLAAIGAMQISPGITWECLVVNNASTDQTGAVAVELGKKYRLALRVVDEPKPGHVRARECAAREARGELLSFVDDDNLVAPDWVNQCVAFFKEHPKVGIIGGKIDAVFEDPASVPSDFAARYADALAIRDMGDRAHALVPPADDPPCGAGMTGRTELFRKIVLEIGCFLSGRNGSELTSGDDTEIGLLAQKLGWETWYVPELKMGHLLPPHRLRQDYLDQLIVAGAKASPWLDYLRGKDKRRGRSGLWLASIKWEMMAARMQMVSVVKGKNHPDAGRFPFWIGLYRARAAGFRELARRGLEVRT